MLAIIGGTGLSRIDCFEAVGEQSIATPFTDEDVNIGLYQYRNKRLAFLPRHGEDHVIPPHKINYRANIWALQQLGVKQIVTINAVGGIHPNLAPGNFAVPDQLIDYTCGRAATFFEENLKEVTHIDFTFPFSEELRQLILSSANAVTREGFSQCSVLDRGVYGCTEGPRLETAAEIVRCKQEGCDMVGMTAMPEAALARELDISYAALALSVNWAAGLGEDLISLDEIHGILDQGMEFVTALLRQIVSDNG
jgi:5'-deoxy-5'-methylthioadenosine phosphorylase